MNRKALYVLQLVLLLSVSFIDISTEAKKVIINVPYRVKNVKHTHTIYKIIPHYHKSKGHSHGHSHSHEHEHEQEGENFEYYR